MDKHSLTVCIYNEVTSNSFGQAPNRYLCNHYTSTGKSNNNGTQMPKLSTE